ncbi:MULTISPECIES: restriction endonuclease subunit S [Microcystis]|uniref:Restriction endonuclease subunit S n=1 Tax=Microcystis viridis FACHB-1342 TaxID=2692900 RepID=A0ABR8GIA4_MICVR|nr:MULTISPECIES: restriction endonuclease subunit S [Microcystis]MBD2602866.1 restriction endonuclease subunit S [Microcystis viridis FACHB-1342]MDB9387727.1 restriction endonuclease subunit S [Microcystis aeruginosa CS-583]ODV38215.1 Type I restriction-modification system, specificity subunit S [Microcystis aeruginosa NIES-98]
MIKVFESPNLPDNWILANFGDYLDITGGSQPPKSKFSEVKKDGYVRLWQIRDLGDNPVPVFVDKSLVSKFCSDGDILIGRYGASVGKVFWAKDGAYNVALVKLIFDDKIFHKSFLFYFLQSLYFQRYLKLISKTAQSGFNRSDLYNIELPIAPLPEQHRIVEKIEELFSELDNGVASLKKALEQLKTYRQAVLKWAFEGKLTEKWRNTHQDSLEDGDTLLEQIKAERKRHYQQQLEDWKQALKEWENNGKETKKPTKPQQPKDLPPLTKEELSNLPSLPNGWMWVKIGNIYLVGTGVTPLKKKQEYYTNGSISWVTSGALNDNFVRQASDYITELALSQTNLKLYPKHTLLVALYGEGKTRGKCSELLIEATTNQAIAAIVQNGLAELTRPFLKWFLQKNYEAIRLKSSGGVQPNLNLSIIENTIFPFPSLQEQTKIVQEIESRLSVCDQLEATLTENLNKAEALRQSILKRAFEGKLVL